MSGGFSGSSFFPFFSVFFFWVSQFFPSFSAERAGEKKKNFLLTETSFSVLAFWRGLAGGVPDSVFLSCFLLFSSVFFCFLLFSSVFLCFCFLFFLFDFSAERAGEKNNKKQKRKEKKRYIYIYMWPYIYIYIGGGNHLFSDRQISVFSVDLRVFWINFIFPVFIETFLSAFFC